jgi:hypothetical protein
MLRQEDEPREGKDRERDQDRFSAAGHGEKEPRPKPGSKVVLEKTQACCLVGVTQGKLGKLLKGDHSESYSRQSISMMAVVIRKDMPPSAYMSRSDMRCPLAAVTYDARGPSRVQCAMVSGARSDGSQASALARLGRCPAPDLSCRRCSPHRAFAKLIGRR